MPYEVIARKFRPQRFHDLVGQDQVSVTLQRAIAAGRVPQALLLIGPRGTGKTSTARIVAKSLRCQNPSQGEPCNQCADCLGITAGQQVDVLEIDGASNNGVDAIRSLRESVAYAPASGRYKIYIIDEVHMLSQSAFNALLKTLEEPPAHVVFIMATTEVHKIPLTILSRCQKYHFRKIPTRQIAEHLKKIATQEGFVFEDEALWWVAKLGQGSMRDAQTLLEQLGNSLDRHLTTAGVREVLGLEVDELVGQFFWLLLESTPEAVSEFFQKWLASSVEPKLFMEELLRRLRATLLVQQDDSPATRDLLDLEETQWQSLKR
ncbi:MAG: DNA polymerase III subunit gamma/tau, partial [Bdellovibrionaceae bacterium]|nr:DNA polymerase III subunit gamma/tau [Pseudobdellovibrionaceae bacterium]